MLVFVLPPPAPPAIRFPAVVSKDLNGRRVALPNDLPAERTIVLIAWQREQQAQLDTWIRGLKLGHSPLPWVEVPVIENLSAPVRWFITRGMRSSIANHDAWSHVVTVYLNKPEFDAALGVESEREVQVMVVDRGGVVVERVLGPYTDAGAAKLQAAVDAAGP